MSPRQQAATAQIKEAPPAASPHRVRPRTPWLLVAMALAVGAIGAAAYWGERREAQAALDDFAATQATLARSLAAALQTQLVDDRPTDRSPSVDGILGRLASAERPGTLAVLLLAPGARTLRATDGRTITSPPLLAAFARRQSSVRLRPEEAAPLGLPARTALAGLARVHGGPGPGWGVAAVASAERERDRDQRARVRLLVAIVTAGGVVLLFGGLALRWQRNELLLQHQLSVADLERTRDEALERSARAATLGTLAMGIAHEISTPLGVISVRAEQLAARRGDDERAARAVKAILEQAARINEVVRAFLGLARGEGPAAQPVEPAAIVRGATALVEHRFARAGVKLAVALPPGLPSLHGDRRLLEHALVNLLLNACDACQRGGQVELGVALGDRLAFTVSDDGAGISPPDAARVTEPFFTTKARGEGTGLGLAIVSEIVKHHRGTLTLTPRSPRGTVARMEIPVGEGSTR
jgi:two-component system, NtrC family, sensor kinase